jgi:O-antigen/teichoic acid export membrane protein
VRALAHRIGVDRTVRLSIVTRLVQGVATIGMLGLVLLRLSPVEQGYYLTQASLSALQLLTELGLAYALMQTVSHLVEEHHESGLGAVLRVARRRNAATTLAGAAAVGLVGAVLLHTHDDTAAAYGISWVGPWVALVAGVLAYQQLFPRIALLEGMGRTAEVWHWRAVQELVGGLALLTALASGARLWSLPIGYAARIVFALAWQRRRLPPAPAGDVASATVDWPSTWRFQWRLGVSAISSFLLLQLLGPLLFAVAGPAVAGRVGLAMTLCNGVYGLSTGWLASQAPAFGRLVAQGDQAGLDARFRRVLRGSLLFSAGIAAAVTVTTLALGTLVPRLAERLPPPLVLVPIMAAAVAHHYVYALATYLRAERQEPMLVLYVWGSVATAIGLALAATLGSPVVVAVAYLGLIIGGAAVATLIFRLAATRRSGALAAALPASPARPPEGSAHRG